MLQLSSLTALQVLFSFGIQAYTVLRLGAGVQTDALAAGYTVPQVVMVVSTEVLSFVLVPVLAGRAEHELKRNGWELFIGLGCIFTLLTCVLYVAIPGLIPILVPGFGRPGKQLAITLARIQVFSLIGTTWYVVLTALYQVRGRFVWPALTLLIAHAMGVGVVVWKLPQFGISLVAWIQLFLTGVPALLLLPILGSVRNFTFDFSTLRRVLRDMRPLCLGAAYFKTSAVPDRLLGSFLAPGSVVILDLANRTYGAIERVLNQGIVTPIVPTLVTHGNSGNWTGFRTLYRKKLVQILFINGVIVLAVFLAHTAVSSRQAMSFLAHMPGSLGPGGVKAMVAVFVCMSGRLLFSGPNHVLASAFYAAGDRTTPTKIIAFTYTVGLLARVAGFFILGLRGIALAASFWVFITFIALDWRLRAECIARIRRSSHRPATTPERLRATAQILRIARSPLVLMYHGVPQRGRAQAFNAKAFEQNILFLKRNCTFIRPEQYATARGSLRCPAVLLTLDDGFRNNAEVAAPILRRYGVPAVFFISSRHCTPGKYLWFIYLKMLGAHFPGDGVTLNGKFISLQGKQRGVGIQELTSRLLALKPHPHAMHVAIDAQLPPLESFVSAAVLADECAGMTAEQVRELGKDPLFTVGAHTVDHPYLTRCDTEEAERQISENKTWLERVTGSTCDLFAYPLDDFDSNILEQCRRIGFQQTFSVRRNRVSLAQFATPRVGVYSTSLYALGIKLWIQRNLRGWIDGEASAGFGMDNLLTAMTPESNADIEGVGHDNQTAQAHPWHESHRSEPIVSKLIPWEL